MSNMIEYNSISAFHPGYYVAEIIEDMGINQTEFAVRMGTTAKTLSKLVNGQINLSNDLAKKLSIMTNTSVELWLNLQTAYDIKLIEIDMAKDIDEQKKIAEILDYSYFVKFTGLPSTSKIDEKVKNLCKYLMISNLNILEEKEFLINFNKEMKNIKNIIHIRTWLQTAINLSDDVDTKDVDVKKLKSNLKEIKDMTVKKEEEFLPELKRILSDCGIALVLLPSFKECQINSIVKWINNNRVVLAISSDNQYVDKFWFILIKSIKCIMQKKVKTVIIDSDTSDLTNDNKYKEYPYEFFTTNFSYNRASFDSGVSKKEIVEYARKEGIHPGIVLRLLQHDKIIPMNKFSDLKKKYII